MVVRRTWEGEGGRGEGGEGREGRGGGRAGKVEMWLLIFFLFPFFFNFSLRGGGGK